MTITAIYLCFGPPPFLLDNHIISSQTPFSVGYHLDPSLSPRGCHGQAVRVTAFRGRHPSPCIVAFIPTRGTSCSLNCHLFCNNIAFIFTLNDSSYSICQTSPAAQHKLTVYICSYIYSLPCLACYLYKRIVKTSIGRTDRG